MTVEIFQGKKHVFQEKPFDCLCASEIEVNENISVVQSPNDKVVKID